MAMTWGLQYITMKGPVPLLPNEANDSGERLMGKGRALLVTSQQVEDGGLSSKSRLARSCRHRNLIWGFCGSLILAKARWIPEWSLIFMVINSLDVVSMLSTGH